LVSLKFLGPWFLPYRYKTIWDRSSLQKTSVAGDCISWTTTSVSQGKVFLPCRTRFYTLVHILYSVEYILRRLNCIVVRHISGDTAPTALACCHFRAQKSLVFQDPTLPIALVLDFPASKSLHPWPKTTATLIVSWPLVLRLSRLVSDIPVSLLWLHYAFGTVEWKWGLFLIWDLN
jgi:hypothetical protein